MVIWYQTLHNSSQAPQRRLYRPLSIQQPHPPHSNMYPTIHYLLSFMLVMTNCLSPVNWKYCLPVNEWFPPYFNDYSVYMEEWG